MPMRLEVAGYLRRVVGFGVSGVVIEPECSGEESGLKIVSPRMGALEPDVSEPVGVLLVHRLGVGLEQAVQSQCLIHLVQMVHEVVIPDNLAKVIAAAAYQAVVLAETEGEAGDAK